MTKVLIAGDYVPLNRISLRLEKGDYSFFEDIRKLESDVDYSIINLECPLVIHDADPIEKTGPNLKCHTFNLFNSLKYAGFDCVTLANNHYFDYGDTGVSDTLDACKDFDIDYVGGGRNITEASNILFKEFDGKKVAFINCCEEEFSIATDCKGGSNPLNPISQYYAIKEARSKSDYVIVIVHGGVELYNLPTPDMKRCYRFFVDCGADVVINHHQHCYSGYEIYRGKPIFYGLGNFCFDKKNSDNLWQLGYMVKLIFDNIISFELIPYRQCGSGACVKILTDDESDIFKKDLEKLNRIISDDAELQNHFEELLSKTDYGYTSQLLNYDNRYLRALHRRGLSPSFISRRMLVRLLGNLRCVSNLKRLEHAVVSELSK